MGQIYQNRLKGISWTAPNNTPARIAYTYDGYSRRVLKREYRTIGGMEKTVEYVGFIYDGWNHVMTVRLNTNNTPVGRVASYAWGPDVGSAYGEYAGHQKAGGVGGLCLVLDGSTTSYYNPYYGTINDPADDDYFPLMDRMGNVTGYRKAATTEAADSLSAVYEYDAFGQEIRSVGPASDKQPYRFSTKYTEGSTGLVYYGYRWYDAGKGRWINRDPIGERGGLNLFGMVGNDVCNWIDFLGLDFTYIQVHDPKGTPAANSMNGAQASVDRTKEAVKDFAANGAGGEVDVAKSELDQNTSVELDKDEKGDVDSNGDKKVDADDYLYRLERKLEAIAKAAQEARDKCCKKMTVPGNADKLKKESKKQICISIHGNGMTVFTPRGEMNQAEWNRKIEKIAKDLQERFPCAEVTTRNCYRDGGGPEGVQLTSGEGKRPNSLVRGIWIPSTITPVSP